MTFFAWGFVLQIVKVAQIISATGTNGVQAREPVPRLPMVSLHEQVLSSQLRLAAAETPGILRYVYMHGKDICTASHSADHLIMNVPF